MIKLNKNKPQHVKHAGVLLKYITVKELENEDAAELVEIIKKFFDVNRTLCVISGDVDWVAQEKIKDKFRAVQTRE